MIPLGISHVYPISHVLFCCSSLLGSWCFGNAVLEGNYVTLKDRPAVYIYLFFFQFISTFSFSSLYLPALPSVYIYLLFPQFIFTSYFSSCYLPIFSLVYTYLFFLQFIFTYSFPSLYLPVSFPSLYLPVLSPVYIYLLFIQFISPCSFLSLYFYLLFLQFIFTSSSSLYLLTLPPVYIYQSFLQVIFTCFSPNFSGGLPLVQDNSWGQSGEQRHGQRLCSKSEPCRECCSLFMWGICDGSGLKG